MHCTTCKDFESQIEQAKQKFRQLIHDGKVFQNRDDNWHILTIRAKTLLKSIEKLREEYGKHEIWH